MGKKSIAIIILVIILLGVGFAFYYQHYQSSTSSDTVKVGSSKFVIPNGYHAVENNGSVNVTDGKASLCLHCHNDSDIMGHVNYYSNVKKSKNESINITNFNVNGITVYKSNLVDKKNIHYWFMKNDELYEFYTWQGNQNTDKLVSTLISSS